MYVAAQVAYDGTDYAGFQDQVGVPTIQGELEQALRSFTHLEGRVSGSGRTDAGVHAIGQVIAVEVPWQHDVAALERAWNAHLPPAVQVRHVQEAPADFHPRFSALARTYRYTVEMYAKAQTVRRTARSPLSDRYALFEPGLLDVTAMRAATEHLLGAHDFATFGRAPQGENTVRHVLAADWLVVTNNVEPLNDLPGQQCLFTIQANAFLRRMVRSVVGSLLEVGRGRWLPHEVKEALLSQQRGRSAPPAPPQGLVLLRVDYPPSLLEWPGRGAM